MLATCPRGLGARLGSPRACGLQQQPLHVADAVACALAGEMVASELPPPLKATNGVRMDTKAGTQVFSSDKRIGDR